MFAEIPSYLPWALTVAALSLVFAQGLVLGRQAAAAEAHCRSQPRARPVVVPGTRRIHRRAV